MSSIRYTVHRSLMNARTLITALLLSVSAFCYGETEKPAILQAGIHLETTRPIPGDDTGKIQPGIPIKIIVSLANMGGEMSLPGTLYVRYGFAPPLEKEAKSILFETEKKSFSPIEPGKTVDIIFDTPHSTPSLLDFVRGDWPIREYQAIAIIDGKEHMLGSLAITFSAYYYPGIKKEFPTVVLHKEE